MKQTETRAKWATHAKLLEDKRYKLVSMITLVCFGSPN